jgi:1-acyl-sn-glycerol-3-phosphate acyltransferase
MFYRFIRAILIPFVKVLFLVRIVGRENEPDSPYIVCANHSSFSDPVFIALPLKRTQRFVARSTLIRFRFFNWLFKKVRVITIKRGKSDVHAVRSIISVIKQGDCVAIFPQGTRKKGILPEPEQAEAGLGLIASMTKVPVLPVSIITKRLRPGLFRRTKIIIGKPIMPQEYLSCCEEPRKKDIAEYCFSFVCNQFNEQGWYEK